MGQVLKKEIEDKIYIFAKKEFFEKGYKGATMRSIAQGAGIPVGLVYSYFANKEELFVKVVQPIYNILTGLLLEDERNHDLSEPRKDSSLFEELGYLLKLFKDSYQEFIILIDKSEGTKYENVKANLIKMCEEHIKISLLTKVKDENKNMDGFFFHILAYNFMESIFEIGRNYKNEEWAEKMLNLVAQQYFYGVNSF